MAAPADGTRDAFLAETRIGIITTLQPSGFPSSVPVWFEWDGEVASVFTTSTSPKVTNLERDSRATLLVVNNVGEPEYWVRIEGTVAISKEGAGELAERLANRYWDMSNEGYRATVEEWKQEPRLRVLELNPTRVTTYP